ncbi:hypothetical protein L195_g035719, partial [Trifolium pratense]
SESKPNDEDQPFPAKTSDQPDNMDTDLPNQSSKQPASPVLVHTCAPPPPLTMADLVMSASVFDEAFEHISENPEVDVDTHVNLIFQKDLNSIKFKRKTFEIAKPYLKPYTFTKTFNPNSDPFDILSSHFYCDLLRLSELRNKFFIFPSDVDAEVSAFKAKLSDVLDVIAQERLTHISHEEIEAARSEAVKQAEEARKAEEERLIQLARDSLALIAKELEAKRLQKELAEATRLEE